MLGTVLQRTDTPRCRKSSATRQRIIAAALRLFARHGVPATTVRDIAHEAGISDAAIYYYFATKEQLMIEVLGGRLQPAARRAKRAPSVGIHDVVRELVHEAAAVIHSNQQLFKIILTEALAGDPFAVKRYDELVTAWQLRVEGCLKPLDIGGENSSAESESLACQIALTTVIAFEDSLLLRPGTANSCAERIQRAQAILTHLIDSLLAQRAGPSRMQ